MSEEIIIRQVAEGDYYKKHLELYEESYAIQPSLINHIDYQNYIQEQKEKNNHIFVMEENNIIIGSASCFIETKLIHNFGKVAHIEDVIISNKQKGKGLGKQMIEYCIRFAEKYNCYKIILDCDDDNVIFYNKCGFKRKGNMMSIYFK
jgi:glucosamine-phosphate N-acetyltransferase